VIALLCGLSVLAGCPQTDQEQDEQRYPPGYTGEVATGSAVQVVPLFVDTALTLWDDCGCPPAAAFTPATAQIACGTPGMLQDDASITFEMSVPESSEGSALAVCSLALTFQLEDMEDSATFPARHHGELICDLSHTAVMDAFNYGVVITVSLSEDTGQIDSREFSFCELETTGALPELGTVMVCSEPYAPGTEQIVFSHMFEAGFTYELWIEVSANMSATPSNATWGGEILFGLDVDSVRIEF
jgi:hypothetical protein